MSQPERPPAVSPRQSEGNPAHSRAKDEGQRGSKMVRIVLKRTSKKDIVRLAVNVLGEFYLTEGEAYQNGCKVRVMMFDTALLSGNVSLFVEKAMAIQRLPVVVMTLGQSKIVKRSAEEELRSALEDLEALQLDGGI